MRYDAKKIAGFLLFAGAAQFVLGAILAEALDSSYSFGQPLMFLGAGPAAGVFNLSLFLLGAFCAASAYFVYRAFGSFVFFILLGVTGVAFAGVSVFSENLGLTHVVLVRTFMIFAVPTTISSFKFQKSPFSFVSVALGLIILVAVILFLSGAYVSPNFLLGLSRGAMQRMIIYPLLLWMLGFGAYLTGPGLSATAK